jgi:hypothetical protein
MAKYRCACRVNVSPIMSLVACQEAIARLGWRLTRHSATRLVCVEVSPAGARGHPVQVTISLRGEPSGPTELILSGSTLGWGAAPARRLKHCVDQLRQHIEQVIARLIVSPETML